MNLGMHTWTGTDIPSCRCQGWAGMWPLLWYNLSWSSHHLPLITIPANMATPQEQDFAILGVVGSLPLIYGAKVWQNPWPIEQWEVGQPWRLWRSSRSLISAKKPAWWSLNALVSVTLGMVVMISGQRLRHHATSSTSQVTHWPLDRWIGMT